MRQPDALDIGTKMDVVRHRLNVASKEITSQQIETAIRILELAEKYLLVENES